MKTYKNDIEFIFDYVEGCQSVKDAFKHLDSTGKRIKCEDEDALNKALEFKSNVNKNVQMWAGGWFDMLEPIRSMLADGYPKGYPEWVFNNTMKQIRGFANYRPRSETARERTLRTPHGEKLTIDEQLSLMEYGIITDLDILFSFNRDIQFEVSNCMRQERFSLKRSKLSLTGDIAKYDICLLDALKGNFVLDKKEVITGLGVERVR